MTRARLSVLPLALVLAASVGAPVLADPPPVRDAGAATTYRLAGPGTYPEGVGVVGDRYYVGATSDGTLYEGRLDRRQATVFSRGGEDGRTTAIGIKATADRLYVAGGGTGSVFVHDRRSGDLLARFTNGGSAAGATFVNDLALTGGGDAYVTDSRRPVLYRVPADVPTDGGTHPLEVAVDLRGTVFQYVPGFNANGIAVSGTSAYVVQSATGELFRVALDGSDRVEQVTVTDGDGTAYDLRNGDGLLLHDGDLLVLQNAQELLVRLDLDGLEAEVVSRTTDETFRYPTTLAAAGSRLLVVNSQFDRRSAGTAPERPFTVSSVPAP